MELDLDLGQRLLDAAHHHAETIGHECGQRTGGECEIDQWEEWIDLNGDALLIARVRDLEAERNRLAADVTLLRPAADRASDAIERAAALTLDNAALKAKDEFYQVEWAGLLDERERLRMALYHALDWISSGLFHQVAELQGAREVLGDWQPKSPS